VKGNQEELNLPIIVMNVNPIFIISSGEMIEVTPWFSLSLSPSCSSIMVA
jgi:hypothetical protein